MAKLVLPQLAYDADAIDPIMRVAEMLADKLSCQFGEATVSSVHSGTRIHRLLNLGETFENLALVNLYNASRREVAQLITQVIDEINGDPNIRLRIAPRGYRVNDVDISSLAYVVPLLVYSSEDLSQPAGIVFIQTYTTSREGASSLKREDEYEVDE